ncbi:MAG: ABC transporter permease [Thermosipho sp. (in: Bacteria)]|nr:ABC transporter permease [Thermosipho sp. (in: thermotogales)]
MVKYLLKLEIFRSKESTFWFIIFPILLTFILSSIFGNMEANVSFDVGIMGESKLFENMIKELEKTGQFSFFKVNDLELLREKDLDVVIEFPENFDEDFQKSLLLSKTNLFRPIKVRIYYIPQRNDSEIAKDVFEDIFSTFDVKFYENIGVWKEVKIKLFEQISEFNYYEYLFPAIIVMMIMSVAFFGYTNGISYFKREGVLKRLSCTPYSLKRFYLDYTVVSIVQIFLSLSIFFIFEMLIYKVNVFIGFFNTIFFVTLGMAVFLSLGYFLASVVKNPETNVVLGNILFQVFMFAGGFYFNVKDVKIIGDIAKLIPSTYIVDGLRKSFGFSVYENHLFVPFVWLIVSIFAAFVFGSRKEIN